MITDTHAHYDDEKFDEDRDALLKGMSAAGVGCIINMGTRIDTSKKAVELAEEYPDVYAGIGVHPEELKDLEPDYIEILRGMAAHPKVVMIGEIGLDYYWEKENAKEQKRVFAEQLRLAAELDLPVSIHSRDAAADTYEILEQECRRAEAEGKHITGILHCFAYSTEMAERFLKLGFLLGVGGVVTFKNSKKLKETIKTVPLEKLVLETDCPYLAPEPFRGKRNSSDLLPYVAAAIAELKGVTPEEVVGVTTENARKLISGI